MARWTNPDMHSWYLRRLLRMRNKRASQSRCNHQYQHDVSFGGRQVQHLLEVILLQKPIEKVLRTLSQPRLWTHFSFLFSWLYSSQHTHFRRYVSILFLFLFFIKILINSLFIHIIYIFIALSFIII